MTETETVVPLGIKLMAGWCFFAAGLNLQGILNRIRAAREEGIELIWYGYGIIQFATYSFALFVLGFGLLSLNWYFGYCWAFGFVTLALANLAAPLLRSEATPPKIRFGKAVMPIVLLLLLVLRYRHYFAQ